MEVSPGQDCSAGKDCSLPEPPGSHRSRENETSALDKSYILFKKKKKKPTIFGNRKIKIENIILQTIFVCITNCVC